MARNHKAKKRKADVRAKYLISDKQLEKIKYEVSKEATSKASLLCICAMADHLHMNEEQICDVAETITRYAMYLEENKIRISQIAEIIKNETGGLNLVDSKAKKRANSKARYEYLKSINHCPDCGEKVGAGRFVYCEECKEKHRNLWQNEYSQELKERKKLIKRERYHRRKAAGICVQCGREPAVNGVKCWSCKIKDSKKYQQKKGGTNEQI